MVQVATEISRKKRNDADGDAAAPGAVGVRLESASLDYDGRPLFRDIEVTLEAGGFTCLLGPSGVGKSSLLRCLAGLAPLGPGSRLSCDDGGELAGRAAYMDQRDLLLPWLSVLGNVTLGARLRGTAADRARAFELLDRVGLGDHADTRPAALSGGMRQRVALARTLMEDRPVVLMDEPFSALDTLTRHRLQELAAELLRGRTVLMVTHDPMEALRLGHRIHVMAGRPAHLDGALTMPSPPPRDQTAEDVLEHYRELMERLRRAMEATP